MNELIKDISNYELFYGEKPLFWSIPRPKWYDCKWRGKLSIDQIFKIGGMY